MSLRSFLVFFSAIIFIACSNKKQSKVFRKLDPMINKELADSAEITYTDSGLLRAKIFAPELEGIKTSSNPYIEMKKGVKAQFYDDSQHIASYVSSEYGMYKQNEKKVILKRKVVVLNIKGEKLETELLTWDQTTSKIYTDQYVIITTGTETITGT